MAKAYWVAQMTISDPAAYDAYRQANGAALAKYGGRFLVRGGPQDVVEGVARPRMVVIEFPDIRAARECWDSAEYRAARALRLDASDADVVIVEGWAG